MASTIPTIQKINAGVRHVKGEAWEYKWVSPKYVLRKIYVSHSQHEVDYLQFVVSDDTGRETIVSEKYGGGETAGAATNFSVVELDVGEQIKTITGFYCYDVERQRNVLASITFCTSRMTSGAQGGRGMGHGAGGESTYGPYGSNFKEPYGSTSIRPPGYRPGYHNYEIDESHGGFTNGGGRTCFYGLPFCFEMGQSFSGFHGTSIDGQIESIGVFVNDRVVNHDDEEHPAPRGRVRH